MVRGGGGLRRLVRKVLRVQKARGKVGVERTMMRWSSSPFYRATERRGGGGLVVGRRHIEADHFNSGRGGGEAGE
jgi:hypothetical protein